MVQAIMAGLLLNEESDEYWAKFLAFNIDREINAAASGDDKMYMSKARSIASNFRSNQVMRRIRSFHYFYDNHGLFSFLFAGFTRKSL